VVKATVKALMSLRSQDEIKRVRGVEA
jgi:ribosomal protein S5